MTEILAARAIVLAAFASGLIIGLATGRREGWDAARELYDETDRAGA